ncbi:MAG: alpha/beta fold hydrolase [Salinibacter sp.]
MKLHYKKYGTDGPPLLVLHGLLGARGNWHTLCSTAFQDVATVYAVDQRNHGRSPHTDRIDYPTMAADVRSFLSRHDLGAAALLGHSMGGKTAMQTALRYPERVERLIVVDMAPGAYPPQHEEVLAALARIDPTEYDSREAIDDELATDVPSWPIRQFLLKNLHYDGTQYTWQMNLEAIRAHYDDILAPVQAQGGSYDGPALFVRGGDSDYVGEDDRSDIHSLFPNARIETIDGAGHWVHADAPDVLAGLVTDFLTSN